MYIFLFNLFFEKKQQLQKKKYNSISDITTLTYFRKMHQHTKENTSAYLRKIDQYAWGKYINIAEENTPTYPKENTSTYLKENTSIYSRKIHQYTRGKYINTPEGNHINIPEENTSTYSRKIHICTPEENTLTYLKEDTSTYPRKTHQHNRGKHLNIL